MKRILLVSLLCPPSYLDFLPLLLLLLLPFLFYDGLKPPTRYAFGYKYRFDSSKAHNRLKTTRKLNWITRLIQLPRRPSTRTRGKFLFSSLLFSSSAYHNNRPGPQPPRLVFSP